MGVMNFRTAQQFDPETDDSQYSGGLLGRLQAMMQQSQIQVGADSGSTPDGANSDGGPQGGLLGRLAALQAEQSSYQPFAGRDGQPPSEPRDPNFRQLSRVYITGRTQDGIASDRPASYLSQGTDDRSQAAGPNTSAPAPAIKTAQVIWPGVRPLPPPVPVPLPQFPMPAIPDWWKAAGAVLEMYRKVLSGKGGGGDEDEDCVARHEKEQDRCYERYPDYAHLHFLGACKERASNRRNMCYANGGRPDPSEPSEWGLKDEEVFRNFGR
jgi:hypothetical protein